MTDRCYSITDATTIDRIRSEMARLFDGVGEMTGTETFDVLDRFDGDLAGLVLVEVEFSSVEDSRQFEPPDWFGADVTEDRRYKNKQLAVFGIPGNETP